MDTEDSPWGGALQSSYFAAGANKNLDVPSRSSSNANLNKAGETETLSRYDRIYAHSLGRSQ